MTRIIAGVARGRRLRVPGSGTRPTTDRVREAMFSSIESILRAEGREWSDIHVLDLYAGSGALGLEALSRGAAHVTFVECARDAVRILRQNVATVGLPGETIVTLPVSKVRDVHGLPAGIVFMDPPYDVPAARLIDELSGLEAAGLLAQNALAVVERPAAQAQSPLPAAWATLSQRRYGDTVLWYGRARQDAGREETDA